MTYKGYIYKGKEFKFFDGLDSDIPVGWNKITVKELMNKKVSTFKNKNKLMAELNAIKKWFNEHDYYINKVFLGEWSVDDEKYVAYLKERQIKRQRYDELVALISEL